MKVAEGESESHAVILTSGLNIHYELAGQGATALILVHGNFVSWHWRPLLDRLPRGTHARDWWAAIVPITRWEPFGKPSPRSLHEPNG